MNLTYRMKVTLFSATMMLLSMPSFLSANEESHVVKITLPEVPKVPKVIDVKTEGEGTTDDNRAIKFSKRMPPNYIPSAERYGKDGEGATLSHSVVMVGEVDKGRISAYLRGALIDVKTAVKKLEHAGFTIVMKRHLDKRRRLISIVFTNSELKMMASQANRGYIGTLRLLVDKKNKQISITNPLYLGKAMLQNDLNEKEMRTILVAINKEFPELRNSADKLKYQLLPKYQFMNGMPYYKDYISIKRGDDLLTKVKNNKRVVFELKLNSGAVLIGVKLGKRTRKFIKKIGVNNAGMLPYPLLIEQGEAKILDPKYYLSLMYPQLSMEEFMTIATVPEAIVKDCEKIFR